MNRWALVVACLLTLFGSACRRTATPRSPDAAEPPTAAPGASAESGLASELRRQALNRPVGTASVEDVLAAMSAAGIVVTRRQQVLASPLHAHYCVAASAADGLGLSICEFDDQPRAEAGRALSQKAMKGRTFALHDRTLLTVIGTTPSAKAALRAFDALSAK